MNPVTPLKLSSIAFAILWTVWMVWWSGVFSAVNIGVMTACGALAAWLWFLGMLVPTMLGRLLGEVIREIPRMWEQRDYEFVGEYFQVPPPVSAKKVGGQRAYVLARRDEPLALAPVINATGVPAITWTGTDRYFGDYCFNLGNGGLAEEAAIMATWIRRSGHRRVGMIHEISPGGVEYAGNFRYYAARDQLEILIERYTTQVPDDLEETLRKIRDQRPDCLAYLGYGYPTILMGEMFPRLGVIRRTTETFVTAADNMLRRAMITEVRVRSCISAFCLSRVRWISSFRY
jgi:hypothetical protein